MQRIVPEQFKRTYATQIVPQSAMIWCGRSAAAPRIGDLVAAEVISLGKQIMVETLSGVSSHIFPGDRMIGAFGYRHAAEQYGGAVPALWGEQCDLLSVGGVCGEVLAAHGAISSPTRLRVLGAVCGPTGATLNLRAFARTTRRSPLTGQVILVLGTATSSGKTTTVGTLARALTRAGQRVAAAKVTGMAAGKDGRYFASCGAHQVLDFTHYGLPSTAMLERTELLAIYSELLGRAAAAAADFTIVELSDGIFQRETCLLLESRIVRDSVDHVFLAAGDSLSAESGVRHLREARWPLRAVTGLVTASPLVGRELQEMLGVPCLCSQQLLDGRLQELLAVPRTLAVGELPHAA